MNNQLDHEKIVELNQKLYEAIRRNNLNEVKNLVESGADIHSSYLSTTVGKSNPIYSAIHFNSVEILQYFIEKGATHHKNRGEYLVKAINKGSHEIVQVLLENGATITSYAFEEAVHKNDLQTIESLLNYCNEMQELTLIATTENKPEIKSWLLHIMRNRELNKKLEYTLDNNDAVHKKLKI
jgi:ankyrin repeat protein